MYNTHTSIYTYMYVLHLGYVFIYAYTHIYIQSHTHTYIPCGRVRMGVTLCQLGAGQVRLKLIIHQSEMNTYAALASHDIH